MAINGLGIGNLEAEIFQIIFITVRIGAALLIAPIFGMVTVPLYIRLIFSGSIALFVDTWTVVAIPQASLQIEMVIAIVGEAIIGFVLGFIMQLSFAAPAIAAEMIAGSMGVAMATAVDPSSGNQSGTLSQYFNIILTLIFLGLGCHLLWLRLVIESYTALPPGGAWLNEDVFLQIVGFASKMFATAVAIALPVTLVLLLVQIITGVLSRSSPALNLFALGLPAGVATGIAALIATSPILHEQLVELSITSIEQVGKVTQQ